MSERTDHCECSIKGSESWPSHNRNCPVYTTGRINKLQITVIEQKRSLASLSVVNKNLCQQITALKAALLEKADE